jgi:acetylornithine deacetylase/succinyl-diaminopimelate desuccinylase-like protein
MKSPVLSALFLVATLTMCANPEANPEKQWNSARAQAETAGFLKDLIRLDTRNPPGNESRVAHYLGEIFAREGIAYEFLEIEPGRASIVARLKGDGSKRPLLILGHEDVVPVEQAKWTVDPFAGLERDGVIYGRGAFDDKAMVAANLEVMLELKRRALPLARDVIFLAEAGEETGGSGMAQLIERYWSKIDCEFALNEGEGAGLNDGKVAYMTVATSEKIARRARLIARGMGGHGSVPRLDNPVVHLAAAVATLGTWETPARLNDTTREYFHRIVAIVPAEERIWYSDPLTPSSEAAFRIHHPDIYSMLRTSVVPTMLAAGVKINVIPSTAEAALDIRALPDEDPAKLFASLAQVIQDPNIEIVPEDAKPRPFPPASSLRTEMFAALEFAQRVVAPNAITLPLMTNSGSDSAFLRAKGVQAYGITVPKTEAEMATHHGNDERIETEQLGLFTQYLWTAVTRTVLR